MRRYGEIWGLCRTRARACSPGSRGSHPEGAQRLRGAQLRDRRPAEAGRAERRGGVGGMGGVGGVGAWALHNLSAASLLPLCCLSAASLLPLCGTPV